MGLCLDHPVWVCQHVIDTNLVMSPMNFWRRFTRSPGPMRVCTARSFITLKSALTSSASPSQHKHTQTVPLTFITDVHDIHVSFHLVCVSFCVFWQSSRTYTTLACRFVSFVHRFVSADDRNGRTQHSRVVSSRLCIVSCLLTIVTEVHNIRVSFRLVCVSFHLFRDSSQTYFHDICVSFCNFWDSHWCTDIDTDQWVSTALVECTEVPPGHDVCPLPSACSTAAAVSCPSHLCRTPVRTTHHTLDSYYITSN